MSYLPFLSQLADLSDPITMHYFSATSVEVKEKWDKTVVSQADLEVESAIKKWVHTQYPHWGVLGEEFGEHPHEDGIRLIVDPIDSTQNFVRGVPWFATLLAIEVQGSIVAGLVSSPYFKERWWAEKGSGSFYNGASIHVSHIDQLAQAQAFHGSLYGYECEGMPRGFLDLMKATRRQRGVGDYLGHMFVAMGSGEFATDFGLKPWDIAPLKIIVEEAGGKVTNLDGAFELKKGSIVSSNGAIHTSVLELLNS